MNRNSVHVYMFPWYQSRAQQWINCSRNKMTPKDV